MNPEDALRKYQRNLDSRLSADIDKNVANFLRAERDWDTHRDYSRYNLNEPHTSNETNVISKQHSPPSSNWSSIDCAASLSGGDNDPDGEPLEDPELARKMEELRRIEEQILFKKAAIAQKNVEPVVQMTTAQYMFKEEKQEDLANSTGLSYSEQLTEFKGASLKDRVSVILQQRHPLRSLAKAHLSSSDPRHTRRQSPKERMNSSALSKDVQLNTDHPLKVRVKLLMRQRCRNFHGSLSDGKVPVIPPPPPPPSQSPTSRTEKDTNVHKGFLRFLNVLNKGVDIGLLNKIVSGDGDDFPVGTLPPNIQPLVVDEKSDLPDRSESQQSLIEVLQQNCNRSISIEQRTEPPSQESSHNDKESMLEEEKETDRGGHYFGSSSRSKSPPAVEEKKPKVEEQHEQLQNVLKTLGLNLEAEEMSKLADRTQERLYGKKQDGTPGAGHTRRLENRQRSFHRQHRNSSSSRSVSGSFSPSSPRRCSSSRDSSEQRQTSERSPSRDRSSDTMILQHRNHDGKLAQKNRDTEKFDSRETSSHHSSYPQNLDASAAVPYYSWDQDQHAAYYGGIYNGATNSNWNYSQGAISAFCYPSGYHNQQKSSYHLPGSVKGTVYPYKNSFEDINLMVNPDLSKSEGQTGERFGPRCLQVINTNPTKKQHCLMELTKRSKKKAKKKCSKQRRLLRRKVMRAKKMAAQHTRDSVDLELPDGGRGSDVQWMASAKEDSVTQQRKEVTKQPVELLNVPKVWDIPSCPNFPLKTSAEEDSVTEQSEVKPQLTDEEIKANLKKKLEAFNQKMKQKGKKPAALQ